MALLAPGPALAAWIGASKWKLSPALPAAAGHRETAARQDLTLGGLSASRADPLPARCVLLWWRQLARPGLGSRTGCDCPDTGVWLWLGWESHGGRGWGTTLTPHGVCGSGLARRIAEATPEWWAKPRPLPFLPMVGGHTEGSRPNWHLSSSVRAGVAVGRGTAAPVTAPNRVLRCLCGERGCLVSRLGPWPGQERGGVGVVSGLAPHPPEGSCHSRCR